MRMRNNTTPYRGKTLISTLWDAIGWAKDPLTARPQSLLGRAEALCKEGDVLFEHRDWEGASDCYRTAVALGADHPEARLLLLDALYRRARARPDLAAYKDETLAACEEALRLDPDCTTAAQYLARTLQDLGRQAEAYGVHEKATLKCLSCCVRLLTQAVAAEKRPEDRDLPTRLLFVDAIALHAFRLCSAYGQESQGGLIDWEGYLSEPVETADTA